MIAQFLELAKKVHNMSWRDPRLRGFSAPGLEHWVLKLIGILLPDTSQLQQSML